MTNVKLNAAMPNLFGLVDRILQDEFQHNVHQKTPVNIIESKETFDIQVLAPGLKKEDFVLSVDNGLLTISYTKTKEENTEGFTFVKKEFSIDSFKRTFTLTDKTDSEKIEASYTNGILEVKIAKKEQVKPEVKTIKIN